ncbi:hypothetical protein NQ315_014566 [Exocentrus adspersus]|uniref:Peptidase A2 domain-containing protein n=1 Tax=Exocentrus adspersus TaxID=1586481 RepID=A0AAV8VDS6_9CUCU|nr:hypothetical protein NQ315_014566 [Exocentrus adspersus]
MPRDDAREAPGGQAGVTLESGTAQNTLYITSSSIGKVPEYNVSEDFSLYLERLEQYFIANFIDEDRRVAVLLTVIGPQTYKILRDLCDPILPKNKAYTDLCSLLKKQFSPQISVFRKRIEFYEARQKQGETINEWYARMKNLAVNCNFGNLLEPILKDKLVTGLTKGKILDRLCEEDEAKGIQELLELAVKREASMREQTVQSESVHRVTYKKFERRKGDRGASSFRYRGAEKEQPEKGREAEETGHLASVCKLKKNNYLESSESTVSMFSLNTENKVNAIELDVLLNDKNVKMELDTGAGASVISSSLYRKLFSNLKLEKTEIKVKTYNGYLINPLGILNVNLTLRNKTELVKLLVIDSPCQKPLFGRDLMKVFNMNFIECGMNSMSVEPNDCVSEVLREFEDVFSNRLGELNEADGLSRLPIETNQDSEEVECLNFINEMPIDYNRVRVETRKDRALAEVKHCIENGWSEKVGSDGGRSIKFKEKDIVFARDYRNPNRKDWKKAEIEEVLGDKTFLVKVVGENLIWRRHLDQLIQGDREGEKGMNEDGEVVLENELDKNYLSDLDTKENCDTSNSVKDVIGNVNSDSESEVGARPRPRRIIKKPVKLDL